MEDITSYRYDHICNTIYVEDGYVHLWSEVCIGLFVENCR